MNQHLSNNTTDLPSVDDITDLQDALSVSHEVFDEINSVLKESWAGEASTLEQKQEMEEELRVILGETNPNPKTPPAAPSNPIQTQEITRVPLQLPKVPMKNPGEFKESKVEVSSRRSGANGVSKGLLEQPLALCEYFVIVVIVKINYTDFYI